MWIIFILSSTLYNWISNYDTLNTICHRIYVPRGYKRIPVSDSSFAKWLRYLPLKEGLPPVYLYDGRKKSNQSAHVAVIDIDIGNEDLQQCADAIIRLRAEYLYSIKAYKRIHFNLTNGEVVSFRKWINGYRPIIQGNKIKWHKKESCDSSYKALREYLNFIFMYAGTYSLSKELKPVDIDDMQIGDVFIQGGFPGYAVIVVDMAVHKETGEKIFLLAQSYMPAQDIHILKNPNEPEINPWYRIDFGDTLYTPEWIFKKDDLKRF